MDIGWLTDAGTGLFAELLTELTTAMPVIAAAVLSIFLVATVGPIVLKAGVKLVTAGIRRVANVFNRA